MNPPRIGAAALAAALGQPRPTDEQVAVIETGLEPLAVIAGAGSGKTETMAARVVWLIANRLVRPDEVLGLTFTRKAAGELGTRVRRRLAQWRRVVEREQPDDTEQLAELSATEPTVLTYAAYAGRLVAEHALRLGAEPDARLLSEALCWQLADVVVRRWPEPLPEFKAISSLVQWLIFAAGQYADHLVEPVEVTQFCDEALEAFHALPRGPRARSEYPKETGRYVEALQQRRQLVPLIAAYQQAKRQADGVDFGDQMRLAAQLAQVPEVSSVERARYRAVLLDEYQDTGHAQIETLRGLYGGGHAVTAVGDPMQSIYGWRGASAGNMLAFASTFRTGDGGVATVFPLATSFRNDRCILDVANAVAAPVRTVEQPVLRPSDKAGNGEVATAFVETVEDEAEWVAARLAAAWQARPPGDRTAAVLVRRRTQLPMLADALAAAGLPVEIVGLGGLLYTPEVIDVVATLRVLTDIKSGGALMRLLTGARWRIGAADLAVLSHRAVDLARAGATLAPAAADAPPATTAGAAPDPATGATPDSAAEADGEPEREQANLIEALDSPGAAGERYPYSVAGLARLQQLRAELSLLRQRITAPLAELVAEIEQRIGVDIEVGARADRARIGRVHLDRFLDVAADFAAEAGDSSVRAFLAFLEAAEEEENALRPGEIVVEAERVQLLTVHGAKGLEWDIVAVAGLGQDLFPAEPRAVSWTTVRQELPGPLRGDRDSRPVLDTSAPSRIEFRPAIDEHDRQLQERHQEEERRLAYVAVTRARSVLLLSGYAWDTTKKPRLPSAFLTDAAAIVTPEHWFAADPDGVNPRTVERRRLEWPRDPLGPPPGHSVGRRAAVQAGADVVLTQLAALRDGAAEPAPRPGVADAVEPEQLDLFAGPAKPVLGPSPSVAGDAAQWQHDVDTLLAERARLGARTTIDVELPRQLSVTDLVELARDPAELAQRLARPLPRPPAPWARRGTAFHTWLEQRWAKPSLLDIDELPGSADETAGEDASLAELRAAFEASEWAARTPTEVEVPFDMAIDDAGTIVRGRMDAVFGSSASGWQVVDWKTGSKPSGATALAAALQLAAYRLAWARLNGIPDDQLHTISAAFHYVRSNETVRPLDLLDADGLRRLIIGADEPPASDVSGVRG